MPLASSRPTALRRSARIEDAAMIRVILFLVTAALLALGIAWFADRPGEVSINWLGYRVETSVLVAGFAVALVAAFLIAIWSIYRAILRSPDQVSLFFRHRRAVKGYLAITRGLIAVGAGDVRAARDSANDAARLSPGDPLALLLDAQSAQMEGNRAGAERAFREMAQRDDTKLLGLRGLYIEAQRRSDANSARLFAEEAARSSPGLSWASQAALDYRCAAGDWAGALDALDVMRSSLDKADYRRRRAVLLTARAIALENGDRDTARALALEAVKLAPNLVPAAVLAGRMLAEAGSMRKAGKILEGAWLAGPHPEIAAAYANLRPGDSARERHARIRRLADKAPGHIESASALAQAALETGDFAGARAALADNLPAPTRRVAALMAEIEDSEGDVGRAREWMARAMRAAPDPVWTADGAISEHWLPVSPVSGRLDAFEWKVPMAEIGVQRPLIEPDELTPKAAVVPVIEKSSPPVAPAETAPPKAQAARRKSPAKAAAAKPVETVIPIVHAPDDPGPDSAIEPDPVPEPTSPGNTWDRFRQLFR
jgi:HemY protein